MAVITVVELVVSLLGWRLRHYQYSVEVLLILVGVGVLILGLIADRQASDTTSKRSSIGGVLTVLYSAASLFGVVYVMMLCSGTLDGPGGNGGKPVPAPAADQLLPLPSGLVVLADSTRCSSTNSGPYCMRTLSIGSSDGTPDSDVADRVLRHLHDAHGLTLDVDYSGTEGRNWATCQTAGWWLDRENENVWVASRSPGPQHGSGPSWPENAPAGATTVVSIALDHNGCLRTT